MLPHPAHARQVVLELRDLHLELALGAHRMLGEDVEDQLGAIDNARLERVFQGALLRRSELVVDEQHLGPGVLVSLLELVELAFPDVGARVRLAPVLHEARNGLDACRAGELLELRKLVVRIDRLRKHG